MIKGEKFRESIYGFLITLSTMGVGSWAGALVIVLFTFAVFGSLTGIAREASDQPLKLFDGSTGLIASAKPIQALLILAPIFAGIVAGLISRSVTEGGKAPLKGYSLAILLCWIFTILQTGIKDILFTVLIYPSFLLVYATAVVNVVGLSGVIAGLTGTIPASVGPVPISMIVNFIVIELVFCIVYVALGAGGGLAGKLLRGKKKEQKPEERKNKT